MPLNSPQIPYSIPTFPYFRLIIPYSIPIYVWVFPILSLLFPIFVWLVPILSLFLSGYSFFYPYYIPILYTRDLKIEGWQEQVLGGTNRSPLSLCGYPGSSITIGTYNNKIQGGLI